MSEKAEAAVKRERIFVKQLTFGTLSGSLKTADGAHALAFDLASIPQSVKDQFALAAIGKNLADTAYKTFNGDENGKDAAVAMSAVQAQLDKIVSGTIEFESGEARTGSASMGTIALVARALVELGKSAITFKGVRSTFADAGEAEAVLRALYDDAVKDAETGMTGRQFFGKLKDMQPIKEKIASYKAKVAKQAAAVDAAIE